MSKRKAMPIETLLKIKSVNPNFQFGGEDLRVYNEFLEKQAEAALFDVLEETPKKVKQTRKATKTEEVEEASFEQDVVLTEEDETDEESSSEEE